LSEGFERNSYPSPYLAIRNDDCDLVCKAHAGVMRGNLMVVMYKYFAHVSHASCKSSSNEASMVSGVGIKQRLQILNGVLVFLQEIDKILYDSVVLVRESSFFLRSFWCLGFDLFIH
jgi:hypothetical protein